MAEDQKGLTRGDRSEAVTTRDAVAWREMALGRLTIGIRAARLQPAHQRRLEGDKTDGHDLFLAKCRMIAMAIARAGDGDDPKAARALAPAAVPRAEAPPGEDPCSITLPCCWPRLLASPSAPPGMVRSPRLGWRPAVASIASKR